MANIIGLDRLLQKLDKIAGDKAAMQGVEKGCLRVEAAAKELCAVDTGLLRASIQHELDSSSLSGTVSTNVEYAPYIEFGSRGKGAHAFMYPALANNLNSIKADIIESLKNEIRGV